MFDINKLAYLKAENKKERAESLQNVVISLGMMISKAKKMLLLALAASLPGAALAVSEIRKITIPTAQTALPSLETVSAGAFEHPTATHIPVEDISAISEIMDEDVEGATEELDTSFLTATDQ